MSLLNVQNIGKAFRNYSSEWHRIGSWFGLPFKPSEESWVLRDISFAIESGEAVGIVGQNGAGKSTLLKMITGTLLPTKGSISVNGRISAILELGMGFNPDLTGRQNVYHSASIMGFSKESVDDVIADIEAFAEIGEYFDAPVRTYSSGMQVRVAFAVATAWRPEILIVDEALSVGDSYFQHKSFSRIREFQKQGTTLLIVSHDKGSIQALCNRAILIEKGAVIKDGNPEEVMNFYNAIIADKKSSSNVTVEETQGKAKIRSGGGQATITNARIVNDSNESLEFVQVGEPISLVIEAEVHEAIPEMVVGYQIKDRLGQSVFGTNTYLLDAVRKDLKKGDKLEYRFAFPANIGVGSFSVTVALHSSRNHVAQNYDWQNLAVVFNTINSSHPEFEGVSWLQPTMECIEK